MPKSRLMSVMSSDMLNPIPTPIVASRDLDKRMFSPDPGVSCRSPVDDVSWRRNIRSRSRHGRTTEFELPTLRPAMNPEFV
ncbi:hypothetical protein LSAT2_006113 [Lamellibrachia satsuma]|nr:hypothetical protein LSAT2_006113 [Lamellibrachia satsuma]